MMTIRSPADPLPPGPDVAPGDILAGTLAELTWIEVEQAARARAVLLWAFGVIEQHGPHLPVGTDVYLPAAGLRAVVRHLFDRGIRALIVPPYYWGINVVSGSFPASFSVRPELMREVMADLFEGMSQSGFQHIFCFSGHGDAAHNQAVYSGVKLGRERTGADISFVTDTGLAHRLGLPLEDPLLTVHPPVEATDDLLATLSPPVDVHAGRWETSLMMHALPRLVRESVRTGLIGTDHGPDELARWRTGYGEARRLTPEGYLGDPAAATDREGARLLAESARRAAAAIERRLLARPAP